MYMCGRGIDFTTFCYFSNRGGAFPTVCIFFSTTEEAEITYHNIELVHVHYLLIMIMGIKRHFNNILVMSYAYFIGGKSTTPGEKLRICHKLLTNFITFTSPQAEIVLANIVVTGTVNPKTIR